MTKMISSCTAQNPFTNTPKHKCACTTFKCPTKSIITNFQSSTQNHHHCPKRELQKKSITMANHVFCGISTAFPLGEISFVRSIRYFYVFGISNIRFFFIRITSESSSESHQDHHQNHIRITSESHQNHIRITSESLTADILMVFLNDQQIMKFEQTADAIASIRNFEII